ncbi:MAG TPA: CsbD family protein [Caulobacteraceae bacterium]|jgi:uncharacterized protein YjbJ (UPF0337 family)|nr:CsbD family protein [Caulobacteraceae bacterium]
MDENRIEGAANEGVGRLQDAWGGLTGDPETQLKGKWRQAQGTAQKLFGKARDQAREQLDLRTRQAKDGLDKTVDLIEAKPMAAVGVATFVGLTLGLLMKSGRSARVVYLKH